jgi:hypothetical protein
VSTHEMVSRDGGVVAPASPELSDRGEAPSAGRIRDHRGRFIRRATNGSHPE